MRLGKLVYKRVAVTTEERLWKFVAEQAKTLFELATDENSSLEKKKQIAGDPYAQLKKALQQLGVLR